MTSHPQIKTNMAAAEIANSAADDRKGNFSDIKLPYIVFDCETSGLDEENDRIIQLAMVKVFPSSSPEEEEKQQVFDKLFNPEISRESQLPGYKIHKISPDVLLTEKPFQSYAEEILEFFSGIQYVIGHNVLFDVEFLLCAFNRLGLHQLSGKLWKDLLKEKGFTIIDTHKMSIVAYPCLNRHRLVDVANHLGIESARKKVVSYSVSSPKKKKKEPVKMETGEEDGLHDAMMDVLVTNEIFTECYGVLEKRQKEVEEDNTIMNDSRYTYRFNGLELVDKSISNEADMTNSEKKALNNIANVSMSSLHYTKGKFLKDLSKGQLESDIAFLKKRNGVSDKREIKLRETAKLKHVLK